MLAGDASTLSRLAGANTRRGRTMTESVWDKFLTERARQEFIDPAGGAGKSAEDHPDRTGDEMVGAYALA
jgi:hypothetical protein